MTASANAIVTTPNDRTIRTERIFAAPRERVWAAMTDPAQVAQWWGRGNRLMRAAGMRMPIRSWRVCG
jgi:uncharacterized protein YndB with AHSA1/START domain